MQRFEMAEKMKLLLSMPPLPVAFCVESRQFTHNVDAVWFFFWYLSIYRFPAADQLWQTLKLILWSPKEVYKLEIIILYPLDNLSNIFFVPSNCPLQLFV